MNTFTNRIIEGDCLKVLPQIPANSVDVAFADPPFNLKKKYHTYTDQRDKNDYIEWCRHWLWEMVRVTKPTGSIFVHNIPKWLTYYANLLNEVAEFRDWIAWNAPTAPMGKALQPAHYGILYYAKQLSQNKVYEIRSPHHRCRKCEYLLKDYGGKKQQIHPFGPLLSDIWTDIHRIRHKSQRDTHPCQLPIHLLERIILMSSEPDDVILDPFIGTGTTAIAAKRLGRNYIGIEMDKDYVKIAKKKIKIATPTAKIGDAWVSSYRGQIITIRDKDWETLKHHFTMPDNITHIEFEKITQNAEGECIHKQKQTFTL